MIGASKWTSYTEFSLGDCGSAGDLPGDEPDSAERTFPDRRTPKTETTQPYLILSFSASQTRAGAESPPPPTTPSAGPGPRLKRVQSAPAAVSRAARAGGRRRRQQEAANALLQRTSNKKAAPSSSIVRRHYPPLELCVASGVRLPGISTEDFFSVFFAGESRLEQKRVRKTWE